MEYAKWNEEFFKSELGKRYAGEWALVLDGRVIEHDANDNKFALKMLKHTQEELAAATMHWPPSAEATVT